MGTIDFLVLIIAFIEHVLNNLTQKKAWKRWISWNIYKRGGPKTKEQKPKIQDKELKKDPSGLEIGKPRERVENSKGYIFRPFPCVTTIGNFSFRFMAPKCMVGMTLNIFFYWISRPCHVPSYTKAFEKVWTHALNKKWNLMHGPAWLIYRPLPWSVALCARFAHLAIWKLSFSESGKFGASFF
jgi:hypothetical protein